MQKNRRSMQNPELGNRKRHPKLFASELDSGFISQWKDCRNAARK
jgi:hypothetical protein